MRLGLATCRPLPEPDVDEEIMLTGFAAAGFEVSMIDWHASKGENCDLIVIRSTWDYPLHAAEFRTWLQAVESKVWNPTPVCLWNLDKRYLDDLKDKGVPVVETLYRRESLDQVNWPRFVVKPTVSAGSWMTQVFHDRDSAREFVDLLSATHEPMFQPYLASVEGEGERSIMWIDGEITHAIRKEPRFADGHESVSPAYDPSSEEREISLKAIEAAPGPLMYARIDLMRDDKGVLCVSELELLEPSLFLTQNPSAVQNLVQAVERRA